MLIIVGPNGDENTAYPSAVIETAATFEVQRPLQTVIGESLGLQSAPCLKALSSVICI